MRRLSDFERFGLRTATRLLIERVGGLRCAGEITGRSKTHLGRYQEEPPSGLPARFMPLDVLAELERFAGTPLVTAQLAELSRHVLLPLPPTRGHALLTAAIGKVAKEAGEVITRTGEALADGRLSPREASQCLMEIDQAAGALMDLRAALEALSKNARGGPK